MLEGEDGVCSTFARYACRVNCYIPLSLPIETGNGMIFLLYKIVNLCVRVCIFVVKLMLTLTLCCTIYDFKKQY